MLLVMISWLLAPWIWLNRWRFGKKPVNRILLIQTAKIGDVLCATPVTAAIRARYPGAVIGWLVCPLCAPLVENNPLVNFAMVTPPRGYKGMASKIRLVRQLYRHRFDLVIGLNPSLPLWLLPVIAGVPRNAAVFPPKMSATLKLASFWIQTQSTHDCRRLQLETVKNLLAQLDIPLTSFKKTVPVSKTGIEKAKQLLGSDTAQANVSKQKSFPLVGLGIAAANKLKELSEPFLVEVITGLIQAGNVVVMVGSLADKEKAARLMAQIKAQKRCAEDKLIDSCGQFDLIEVGGLLRQLSLWVGVDSGISFYAEACGIPQVILMGPTPKAEMRPTEVPIIVLEPKNLACSPCSFTYATVSRCKNEKQPLACLLQINMTEVLQAAFSLIDQGQAVK